MGAKSRSSKPTADYLVLVVQRRPSCPKEDSGLSLICRAQYTQSIYVSGLGEIAGDKYWISVKRSGPTDILRIKHGQVVTIEYEKEPSELSSHAIAPSQITAIKKRKGIHALQ